MKRMLRNRRAVSPVIASLLLIAIAVAASVITYSWVMSMVKTQGSQAQTSLRLDEAQLDVANSENQIKMDVRNTGSVAVLIKTLYVYHGDTLVVKQDDIDHAIPQGELHEIGFTDDATAWETGNIAAPTDKTVLDVTFNENLATSAAYKIKLVTENGFSVEGTYYSPSSW